MITAKFATEAFTCPSCVKKIESTVGRMEGVDEVSVLFNSSKVKVTFDDALVNADAISQTITKLGYPVLGVK
ncbi:MAG: heavy-metal-associated domain-containing protein [Actinomycetaceae bacterium]|nr:heavy-metal-associated domain-containing protein [Actinomycetaceae bacterium]